MECQVDEKAYLSDMRWSSGSYRTPVACEGSVVQYFGSYRGEIGIPVDVGRPVRQSSGGLRISNVSVL